MKVSQEIENIITIFSIQQFYFWTRIEDGVSNRYSYTCVQSSVIHNSQKKEATQVSTDGCMDKYI